MSENRETILIVDDEVGIRRVLRQKLSDEGYQCQEAASAAEALERLRSAGTVALAILDIRMPGKSGIELLPEIKAGHSGTAVIMATAVTDIDIAIQCMKQGAYDYIPKPFNLDEVVISVNRTLEKRRLELKLKDYHEHLEQEVQEQARKIRTSFLNAITALAYALDAKDEYTSGHSQRVAGMSVAIASELDMPDDDIEKIRLAGLIHDIGKIGVRESVLNKPGKLTDKEFEHVKQHCELGQHILAPIAEHTEIPQIIKHHHERYDGTGYPDGLSQEQIPMGARILAVADAYDAMTSERPYRKAMEAKVASAEIERGKGNQFDPQVVDAFLKVRESMVSALPSARRG